MWTKNFRKLPKECGRRDPQLRQDRTFQHQHRAQTQSALVLALPHSNPPSQRPRLSARMLCKGCLRKLCQQGLHAQPCSLRQAATLGHWRFAPPLVQMLQHCPFPPWQPPASQPVSPLRLEKAPRSLFPRPSWYPLPHVS